MLVVIIGGATGDQCGEAPSPQTHGNSSAALENLMGVSHPIPPLFFLALGREGGDTKDVKRAHENFSPLRKALIHPWRNKERSHLKG